MRHDCPRWIELRDDIAPVASPREVSPPVTSRPPALHASLALTSLALLKMSRPAQLGLIVLVYASGVLLGYVRGGDAPPAAIAVGGLLLLLAAVSVHLTNEYVDIRTDTLTVRTRFSGGSGVLPAGIIDPSVARGAAVIATVATSVAALAFHLGGALPEAGFLLLMTGLVGGLAYSLPPVAASRRGLGELTNALLGGFLLPLYGVAIARGSVTALDMLAFVPFALVVFASVMATAWPDRTADAATGKRTLQTRLSARSLRSIHAITIVLFIVAEGAAAVLGASPAAPLSLAVLPLLLLAHRRYTVVAAPTLSVAAMVFATFVPTVVFAAVLLAAHPP